MTPFFAFHKYILQIYIAGVDYIDGGNIDSTHTDSTDPDVKAEKGKQFNMMRIVLIFIEDNF